LKEISIRNKSKKETHKLCCSLYITMYMRVHIYIEPSLYASMLGNDRETCKRRITKHLSRKKPTLRARTTSYTYIYTCIRNLPKLQTRRIYIPKLIPKASMKVSNTRRSLQLKKRKRRKKRSLPPKL